MIADNMSGAPNTTAEQSVDQAKLSPFGRIWTHVLRAISFILGIAMLSLCFWFFVGFAANDTYPLHLMSAALLCFGIGAPTYIPAFMIAYTAHEALKTPPKRRTRFMAICLVLPWLPLSWYLSPLGGMWIFCAVIMMIYCLITAIWIITARPVQP